jgi:hypothetical protein
MQGLGVLVFVTCRSGKESRNRRDKKNVRKTSKKKEINIKSMYK